MSPSHWLNLLVIAAALFHGASEITDDTFLTGVENMISTFSDVVESGGDIFVSLGLMPPAAAAAVNLSFDVAKWFVGLWKSLKPPSSDQQLGIDAMKRGLASVFDQLREQLSDAVSMIRLHIDLTEYSKKIVEALVELNDYFGALVNGPITESTVDLYRSKCSLLADAWKYLIASWVVSCGALDLAAAAELSLRVSAVFDEMAQNTRSGSADDWRRFEAKTTELRVLITGLPTDKSASKLADLNQAVFGRQFASVADALEVVNDISSSIDRSQNLPCVPRDYVEASNYTTFRVVQAGRMIRAHVRQLMFHGTFCALLTAKDEAASKAELAIMEERSSRLFRHLSSFMPAVLDSTYPKKQQDLARAIVAGVELVPDNLTYTLLGHRIWDSIRPYGRPK